MDIRRTPERNNMPKIRVEYTVYDSLVTDGEY